MRIFNAYKRDAKDLKQESLKVDFNTQLTFLQSITKQIQDIEQKLIGARNLISDENLEVSLEQARYSELTNQLMAMSQQS